jgi:hypothetical protein
LTILSLRRLGPLRGREHAPAGVTDQLFLLEFLIWLTIIKLKESRAERKKAPGSLTEHQPPAHEIPFSAGAGG